MSEKIQQQLLLAEQYARAGAYTDAQKALRRVIDKARTNVGAWLLLGQVYGFQQAHADAEQSFAQAARLNPGSLDAHAYLGLACMHQDKNEQAIVAFKAALAIQPRLTMALANLVTLLHKLDRQREALPYQERWLELEPNSCSAHYSAAVLNQTIQQLPAARKHYEQVLKLGAAGVSVYSTQLNLGVVCHGLRDFEAAIAHSRQALSSKPDCAVSYYNIGNAQKEQGKLDEAIASFDEALKIDPNFVAAHSNILFSMNFVGGYDAQRIYERHIEWAERHAARYIEATSHSNVRDPMRTLRIGYVSADFREHPVGFFLEGVLQYHSATNCEIYCYSNSAQEDAITERLRTYVPNWRQISALNDDAVAAMIRADGIDVLVDLSGHTSGNRLLVFARKPAPVQVTWLGYFNTTGLSNMDYLLADEVGVPEPQRQRFTEAIWYLPDTMFCFTPPSVDLPVAPLPAMSNGMITFGCFQNLAKVDEGVLKAWGDIFSALPNAKLRMQCRQLGNPVQIEQMTQRLQRYGITPSRVIMHGPMPREGYLAAHSEVDLILDTFPYTGCTTTSEALWMGVPTLTLAGDTLYSRQGASLLTAAGLKDWVAVSRQDYVDRAIALAGDLSKLAALRAGLREQVLASPLFDPPRFTHNLEEALWGMWQAHD